MGKLQPEILQDFERAPQLPGSPVSEILHLSTIHTGLRLMKVGLSGLNSTPKKGSFHILTAVFVKRRGKGRFVLNRHM